MNASRIRDFVRAETSGPVFNVTYRYGQNVPAKNGAYGANVHAPRSAWFLEEQRAGGLDIIDGAARPVKSLGLVALGLKMFHYGLGREAANGSFPGSAWPFHGTALFLSEAAPALIVLKSSSLNPNFREEIDWDVSRMQRAAYYMVRSVGGAGHVDDRTKTHRRFEAAIALGATGVLASDRTLVRWSETYARQGIHMERPDGVMPEDGGHDSGYQAVGMINASRYLVLVARGKLRTALGAALAKGEAWELSRVRPDGSVNQTGDTRTVGCSERNPQGQCKTVFYAPIFEALAWWAAISGDAKYAHASKAVWRHSGYGAK
ncbi:MAG: hypothetical protein ACRDFS_05925 [Chloroflexota bacterium]